VSPRPADPVPGAPPPSGDGPTASDRAARLLDAAGVPEGRRGVVGAALAQLLGLAASLDELPLEGVPPAPADLEWQ
jgi:hypothetical protein